MFIVIASLIFGGLVATGCTSTEKSQDENKYCVENHLEQTHKEVTDTTKYITLNDREQ